MHLCSRSLNFDSDNLEEELLKSNENLNKKVKQYVDTYSKSKGYRIVLGLGSSTNVLYGNDSLDVTHDIVNGLNQLYKSEKH